MRYWAVMLFTVMTGLLFMGFSTRRRNRSAARHADAFVGNSRAEPISFVRRWPCSHQRKFQVLRRLSKTTLPCCSRARFMCSFLYEHGRLGAGSHSLREFGSVFFAAMAAASSVSRNTHVLRHSPV